MLRLETEVDKSVMKCESLNSNRESKTDEHLASSESKEPIVSKNLKDNTLEVNKAIIYLLCAPFKWIKINEHQKSALLNYFFSNNETVLRKTVFTLGNKDKIVALLNQFAEHAVALADGIEILHRNNQYTEKNLKILTTSPQYSHPLACAITQCPEMLTKNYAEIVIQNPADSQNLCSALDQLKSCDLYQDYRELVLAHPKAYGLAIILIAFHTVGKLKENIKFIKTQIDWVNRVYHYFLELSYHISPDMVSVETFLRLRMLYELIPEAVGVNVVMRFLIDHHVLTRDNWNGLFEYPEFLRETFLKLIMMESINQTDFAAIISENRTKHQLKEIFTKSALLPFTYPLRLFDSSSPRGTGRDKLNNDTVSIILSYR